MLHFTFIYNYVREEDFFKNLSGSQKKKKNKTKRDAWKTQ